MTASIKLVLSNPGGLYAKIGLRSLMIDSKSCFVAIFLSPD